MKRNKKRVFIIVLLVGVALSTIFLNLKDSVPRWYSSFIFKEIKIEFDLALHETHRAQEKGEFYYDTGKGFNKTESVKFKYSKKADGQFQHYAVIFKPEKAVSRLRFDPLQGKGHITIKNIVVCCNLPKELNLSPSKHTWLAYKSIEEINHTSNGIEIVTNGRDPHLLIVDNLSEYCQKNIFDFLHNISWFRIMAAIGVIALIFFIPLFSKPLSKLNLLLILPSILLLPAIYYSLDTPFALVDDYGMCFYVEYLDNTKRFFTWAKQQFILFSHGRYRPFFDIYNMVTWKLFGPYSLLHHLSRWVIHAAALGCFAASYLLFVHQKYYRQSIKPTGRQVSTYLIPLILMYCIWLFFPNAPVFRLGPQELNTVLFLGLSNWMIARLILIKKENQSLSLPFTYFLLYMAYFGLSISKEINIAAMIWIIIFYYFALSFRISWRRILWGMPLLIICMYSVIRVYAAWQHSSYGTSALTVGLLLNNAKWIFKSLFQIRVSLIIAAGLLILIAFLFLRFFRERHSLSSESLYVLFLLGEFIAMYLIISTSWAKVLRYWYPLIPILCILLAFSFKYLLEGLEKRHAFFRLSFKLIGCVFIVYFIGSNYYSFMMQGLNQHSLRNVEKRLILKMSEMMIDGKRVTVEIKKQDLELELKLHLVGYFKRFSPRFFKKNYNLDSNLPKSGSHYFVSRKAKVKGLKKYETITTHDNYLILSLIKPLSAFLQGKNKIGYPVDAGVHRMNNYAWYIYKS